MNRTEEAAGSLLEKASALFTFIVFAGLWLTHRFGRGVRDPAVLGERGGYRQRLLGLLKAAPKLLLELILAQVGGVRCRGSTL